MSWTLVIIGGTAALIVLIATGDSWYIRINDLFDPSAVGIFVFYFFDFVSGLNAFLIHRFATVSIRKMFINVLDLFFAAQLWLLTIKSESNQMYYFILFVGSISFIIIPLVTNVLQLNRQIKIWDSQKQAEMYVVSNWIKDRILSLYGLIFICGSSFSVVALANSYLFQLEMFSMGLSKKQRAMFRNKRIFSVVLLEVKLAILVYTCKNKNKERIK